MGASPRHAIGGLPHVVSPMCHTDHTWAAVAHLTLDSMKGQPSQLLSDLPTQAPPLISPRTPR